MIISKRNLIVGGTFAACSSMLFTGKVIVAKLAYARGIDPIGLLLLRMVFSSPVFCFILLYQLRKGARVSFKDGLQIILLGYLGYYLSSLLDFVAIEHISTALERMILQLSPSIVMIAGAIWMGEKIEKRLFFAMAIGYAGVAMMVHAEVGSNATGQVVNSWFGILSIVACTVVFAIYMIFAERVMRRVDSGLFTSLAMLSAALGVFAHYVIAKGFVAPTHDTGALALGLVIAIFCTVVPSYMVNKAIHMIGGAKMGPFNYAGMGMTFVLSAIIIDESFPTIKLLGIALAVAGALALTFGHVKKA